MKFITLNRQFTMINFICKLYRWKKKSVRWQGMQIKNEFFLYLHRKCVKCTHSFRNQISDENNINIAFGDKIMEYSDQNKNNGVQENFKNKGFTKFTIVIENVTFH